jgi:single-strand DNA-binding protein
MVSMPNYNRIVLVGHVTRDAEVKKFKDSSITRFGIATNRNYQKDGQWQSESMFVDVDVFGRLAERAAEIAMKGAALLVEGELVMDTWQDRETGAKRTKHLVRASKVVSLTKQEERSRDERRSEPASVTTEEWDANF